MKSSDKPQLVIPESAARFCKSDRDNYAILVCVTNPFELITLTEYEKRAKQKNNENPQEKF